jgi:hypothetical protein
VKVEVLRLDTIQEQIHAKGFNMTSTRPADGKYASMRVGVKSLDDAILNFGELKRLNSRLASKENI